MSIRNELLTEIEAFTKSTGLAETTIGSRALKDSRFVSRLRNGKAVSLKSIEQMRKFMTEFKPNKRALGLINGMSEKEKNSNL